MRCKNCKRNVLKEEEGEQFSWCSEKQDNLDIYEDRACTSYVPATNADRIRAMRDDELSDMFAEFAEENPSDDANAWYEWLIKPVEED